VSLKNKMIERRKQERCIYCGGTELKLLDDGVIKRICLICGKDFEARRDSDLTEFHKIKDSWL